MAPVIQLPEGPSERVRSAGLINLAKAAGFRAETLNSLVKATNFRRSHLFLLQTYEAFYMYFLSLYLSNANLEEGACVNQIQQIVANLLRDFSQIKYEDDEESFRAATQSLLTHPSFSAIHDYETRYDQILVQLHNRRLLRIYISVHGYHGVGSTP